MSLYVKYEPQLLAGGGGSGGITSINGDTTTIQFLVTGTSGTDFAIVDNGTGTHTFNLPTASATNRGALSSADWSTFNSKQPAGNYITALTGDGSATGPGSATFTLATVNGNVGSFTLSSLTVNAKGLITAASSGTKGNLTDVGTDGITITGGTGAVLGTGTSIAQQASDATHNGYLSSTDWSTFNGKQATGNYITALTGDATASGPGSVALTFATVNGNVGSFTNANITVNAKGLITAASNGTASAGFSYLSSNTSVYGGTNTTLSFTGADNTVVGINAANALTTGADNTLYGYHAGQALIGGSSNSFFGSGAGAATTAATNLVAIGMGAAGTGVVSGTNNVAIGNNAARNLTSGADNVFVGHQANGTGVVNSTGGQSVAIGSSAGVALSSGVANTFMGYKAGQFVTTGTDNVILGAQAGLINKAALLQAVAIGSNVSVGGTNSIVIGYKGNDASTNSSTILGQSEPASTSHTGCFLVGQTSTFAPVTTTTGAGQIVFGTAGGGAIQLQDMFLGRGAIGDATAVNVSVQPSPVVGSNISGGTMTITGGTSTGTGTGGSIVFKTTPAGTTGSAANTQTTALTLDSTQKATFGGATNLPGNATALKAPTIQKFLSGSGTYTAPTGPSPLYIKVLMVGGGGGGGGSGTGSTAGNVATASTASTFGTSLLNAGGGGGGPAGNSGAAGGAGGTVSLGAAVGLAISGANGNAAPGVAGTGIAGASSPLGGAGAAAIQGGGGTTATSNSGSGGSGSGGAAAVGIGGGGAAGGYIDAIITAPSATYSYVVGVGGSAGGTGTGGSAGGAGGSGYIQVTEYYQ